MVEVGDEHIMWPCVFSQSDSVFPEETVSCLAHIYLLVRTRYRVTEKCIFLGLLECVLIQILFWSCSI